jgi:threonine/homoserine/homoserine lactone efflux protein
LNTTTPSAIAAALHGFVTNLLNPKMVTFAWRSCRSSCAGQLVLER